MSHKLRVKRESERGKKERGRGREKEKWWTT